jgi:hypothetical protein
MTDLTTLSHELDVGKRTCRAIIERSQGGEGPRRSQETEEEDQGLSQKEKS